MREGVSDGELVAMPMDTWNAIWSVVQAAGSFLDTAEANAINVEAGREADAHAMSAGYQTLRACLERLKTLDHPGH